MATTARKPQTPAQQLTTSRLIHQAGLDAGTVPADLIPALRARIARIDAKLATLCADLECGQPLTTHIGGKSCVVAPHRPGVRTIYDLPISAWARAELS